MGYEPKEGSGWEEDPVAILPGVRRWRTPLRDRYLSVTVAAGEAFVIARVNFDRVTPFHTVPLPEDLQRIELDFGVPAWRIHGVSPVLPPSTGQCLMATAVNPN